MEKEISLSVGTVRFDPADPNVMCRFQQAVGRLEGIGAALRQQSDPLAALWQADRELKDLLGWVLGCDMDAAVGGKSLLSMAGDRSLLEEILDTLAPVLMRGAQDWAAAQRQRYGHV